MRDYTRYLCGGLIAAPLLAATALAQGGPPVGRGPGMPDPAMQRGQPDRIERPTIDTPRQAERAEHSGQAPDHTNHAGHAPKPLDARLAAETRLSAALTSSFTKRGVALPDGGLGAACTGLSNLGDCVAALNAAHNLSIEGGFSALKSAMTGTAKLSLGQAIKTLKPDADVALAERRARLDAKRDLDEAGATIAR